MGSVIGEILPFAVAVAISVTAIIAVILILFTPKARTNSVAFLFGWVLGLTVVGTIVLIAGDFASDDSGESTASGVVKLVLGLVLLLLAVRNWRSRPKAGEEPEMPGWMATIDDFGAGKSGGTAAFLSQPANRSGSSPFTWLSLAVPLRRLCSSISSWGSGRRMA
jgi:Na+/melibiose symporter-like transporter